jgi:hypothetical protein
MYIVKLSIADLADYYADGTKSPDLSFTSTLEEGPLRVRDVAQGFGPSSDDWYLVDVITESGKRDTLYFDEQASEWFVTTDKEVSDLA